MARIRSIHPQQWTDEAFVSMSPLARLLAIAIRNEADDQGVFEWKPVTLKMRLFPADDVDIAALLTEIEAHDQVRRYEISGHQFGAIRNFCKWQRPRFPKLRYTMPEDFRNYVGLTHPITETEEDEQDELPRKAETGPQRKEVGGRRLDEGGLKKKNGKMVFVKKGTPAWEAHQSLRPHRPLPCKDYDIGGKYETGWFFHSEYPASHKENQH